MSTKKSAAELKVEYERALARAEQIKQKMKRATAAEEAKKKSELLQLVLEWAESYDAVGDIDGAIAWFQNKIEHNKNNKKEFLEPIERGARGLPLRTDFTQ